MTDVTLRWCEGPHITKVLKVLKRWRKLRRLKIANYRNSLNNFFPPLEVLSDFILGMKHLSHLHIASYYDDGGQLEIVRDKVNELILPRRPNFKFDISCSDY
jgi:hypothetical protein